jgi:hypothetical protein
VSSLYAEWQQIQQASAESAIVLFVLGQVVAIVANYLSSKALVENYRDTFPNALRVWVLNWLTFVVLVVAGFVIAAALNAAGTPQVRPILIAGLGFLMIVFIIQIPAAVYRIPALRAVGFVLLSVLIAVVGSIGIQFFIGPSPAKFYAFAMKVIELPPMERKSFLQLIGTKQQFAARAAQPLAGELDARDPSKPLEERAAALRQMYADLEMRRRAIRPGDQKSIVIYQHQKARYEALLSQLRTEAAQRQRTDPRR